MEAPPPIDEWTRVTDDFFGECFSEAATLSPKTCLPAGSLVVTGDYTRERLYLEDIRHLYLGRVGDVIYPTGTHARTPGSPDSPGTPFGIDEYVMVGQLVSGHYFHYRLLNDPHRSMTEVAEAVLTVKASWVELLRWLQREDFYTIQALRCYRSSPEAAQ